MTLDAKLTILGARLVCGICQKVGCDACSCLRFVLCALCCDLADLAVIWPRSGSDFVESSQFTDVK